MTILIIFGVLLALAIFAQLSEDPTLFVLVSFIVLLAITAITIGIMLR